MATDLVNDHQTPVGEDHTGQGGQRRGVNAKGFTGAGIGRLIIPEEAPVTARNTPISRHRQDNQPVSHAGVEHERTHGEALKEPKQCSYMGKITSTLADKATEVKNVVTSKLQGVQSVNWADKLSPGDEDRALSQLISGKAGAHHPDAVKGEERSIPVKERVSDAVHKRASEKDDNDHNDNEVNLMGRVTESEEVARRLGTSEEERRGDVTNLNPTGKEGPVREWIKETVNSWWSTDGNQHPDSSKSGNSHISKLLYGQSMSPPKVNGDILKLTLSFSVSDGTTSRDS